MRTKIQQLYNTISGRTVYVIGGGPSFKLVDKSLLKDKLVICLNNAYTEFDNATALYWCDESWVAKHYDNIINHSCKLRFTARHSADGYIKTDAQATGGATVLKRTGDYGIDPNINHIRGNNSGAQILNLLCNCKVKRIVLLGYDMTMNGKHSHWHAGHGLPMGNYIYEDLFIPSITSMAQLLTNNKIDVVNCSIGTALTCFRKGILQDFI